MARSDTRGGVAGIGVGGALVIAGVVIALFWSVLLIVAAGVAVYRSSVADAGDPDWVVLAGPALVGLAVGQIAVWLVRLVSRLAVGWTEGATLANFLAAFAPNYWLLLVSRVMVGVTIGGFWSVGAGIAGRGRL